MPKGFKTRMYLETRPEKKEGCLLETMPLPVPRQPGVSASPLPYTQHKANPCVMHLLAGFFVCILGALKNKQVY